MYGLSYFIIPAMGNYYDVMVEVALLLLLTLFSYPKYTKVDFDKMKLDK